MVNQELFRGLHDLWGRSSVQPSASPMRLSITMLLRTALLCCLFPMPLAAQAPSDSPPLPAKSGMTVTVPLLVRDKKGAPVGAAAKDALALTEDGTAQNILTLAPADGQPLVFGILVDTSRRQGGEKEEEKAASMVFFFKQKTAYEIIV